MISENTKRAIARRIILRTFRASTPVVTDEDGDDNVADADISHNNSLIAPLY